MEETNAFEGLVNSLTASVKSLSDEVNRTYTDFILKDNAYKQAVALEAETDRQRLEKIADNDGYNASILSEQLRNTIRPNREMAFNARNAAEAAWNKAKEDLQTAKSQLSESEKKFLDSKIDETVANSKLLNQEADKKIFAQKNTQYLIVGGIVMALIVVSFLMYKKLKG